MTTPSSSNHQKDEGVASATPASNPEAEDEDMMSKYFQSVPFYGLPFQQRPLTFQPPTFSQERSMYFNSVSFDGLATQQRLPVKVPSSYRPTFRHRNIAEPAENLQPTLSPLKLIQISPSSAGRFCGSLDLVMVSFEFGSHPPYTALSYTWGDASLEEEAVLNGQPQRIQSNLAAALRQLKKTGTRGYIWADAVCINQNDPAEKSTVVQHMDKIFGAAQKVFAWLGVAAANSTDPTQSSDRLWDHLVELGDLFWAHFGRGNKLSSNRSFDLDTMPSHVVPKLYEMFEKPVVEGGFPTRAYTDFSNRAYWQRIWVLQEVYLARELLFGCGDKVMGSQQLAGALFLLEAFQKRALSDNKTKLAENGALRDFVFASPCYPEMQQLVFHKSIYDPDTHSLRIAMTNFCVKELPRGSKASDSRDMIFGLLGFAKSEERTLITPAYDRPVQTTYREATLALMTHGFTDILAWSQPLEKRLAGLPSWVPDFSSTILESMCSQSQAKWWRPRFHASRGFGPHMRLDNVGMSTETSRLRILAIVVDEISEVGSLWYPRVANPSAGMNTDTMTATSDMASRSASYKDILGLLTEVGSLTSKSLLMADSGSGTQLRKECLREARWRVPCADQVVVDSKLVRGSTKASYEAAVSLATGFVEQTPASAADAVELSLEARPYIEAMLRWVKKRPMMSAKGYVGLGPDDAKAGDSLVLLSGCNAPYILRRVDPGRCGEYEMVGEAYVHGIMHGEILGGSEGFIEIV